MIRSLHVIAAMLAVLLPAVEAGDLEVQDISTIQQHFTTANARNAGACLAVVESGAVQPHRLIVGTAGSNNPSGQIQVGRTFPIEIEPGNLWSPIPSGVTGSPTGDLNNGYYGYRCASSGDRHVVAQRGNPRVHVYRDGVVEQSLVPTLVSMVNNQAVDVPVDVQNNFVALGVPTDNGGRGRVHVWLHNGSSWQFLQVLDGGATAMVGGQFGSSLAFAGELLMVGAPAENFVGRVYVFAWNGTSFQFQGNLAIPAAVSGSFAARIGQSMAVDRADQGVLFVGAPDARLTQLNRTTGTVLAYRFNPANPVFWDPQYALQPHDSASNNSFGAALASFDRALLVSDPDKIVAEGTANSTGIVYRYRFNETVGLVTSLQRLFRQSGGPDNFGWSVAFQGDGVVIGAPSAFTVNPGNGNVYLMAADRLLVDGFE